MDEQHYILDDQSVSHIFISDTNCILSLYFDQLGYNVAYRCFSKKPPMMDIAFMTNSPNNLIYII